MRLRPSRVFALGAGTAVLGLLQPVDQQVAYGAVYLSIEEAQRVLFPGQRLTALAVELTAGQRLSIEKRSGVRVRGDSLRAWRAEDGGVFLVDQVLGKHEFIPYALGIDASGAVVGVEILEYRETYGDQIRDPAWRRQFRGRRTGDPLEFGRDVRNVSGATLSCRHVSDGIKRLLATWEVALRER